MMRSADLANVVWGLFTQDHRYFIKTTDKNGRALTFSVSGSTLDMTARYILQHKNYPALYLLRYTKEPHRCLGADRLAKRVLDVMQQCGLNTEAFKAHSMRGATASHLMEMGVPQNWVQSRGQWRTSTTLEQYYNRLHQTRDWEALMQGEHDGTRQSCDVSAPPTSSPEAEPTKEAEARETRGGCRHSTRYRTPCMRWRSWGSSDHCSAGPHAPRATCQ